MLGTNLEGRGDGDIGQAEIGENLFDEVAASFRTRQAFGHIAVKHRPAGILGCHLLEPRADAASQKAGMPHVGNVQPPHAVIGLQQVGIAAQFDRTPAAVMSGIPRQRRLLQPERQTTLQSRQK